MAADPRYSVEVERRLRELAGAGDLPAGRGVIVNGAAVASDRGARVILSLRTDADRIADARFRAYGCPHFIAAASWLTERICGMSREQLAGWDWHEAADALAVPPAKFGRLLTLQDAARAAASRWRGMCPPAV